MNLLEWSAALTGLVCVWLTVKNRISNWPWGIVSVILYGWIFVQAKLYANAGLQVLYFLPCCIYGWWFWAVGGPKKADDLPITVLDRSGGVKWFIVTCILSIGIGGLMQRYTNDPVPYTDGAVTGMSIVAQYLQAKKVFENWWYWIALDIVCVAYLYPSQHLYITTALYVVFLALAIRGAMEWRVLVERESTCRPA